MALTQAELDLVAQAVAGDRQALTQLIQNRGDYFYRTAYLYVGTQADALDVIQEATTQAVKAVRKLREPPYFYTWFTRILIRQAQAIYQGRKREMTVAQVPDRAAPVHDPIVAIDLLQALSKLGADYRQVLHLYYYQDLSIADISAVLNIPEPTVKTRLRRGRIALKNVLGGDYDG
ncbi:sigma-70 family RNA polymerase sigma factor [Lacticaseibacillus camelliae]|uniref:Uncharacterized protein n=1 Tax=Lacticaseibacillus camelliae DSM 22697 = JCM 13995 TaxID=1423730 RepID=A0A0R2FA77_9LACO|nr:sigma-70 family RNA polymerase sigma factor [Lacticaseibacillus camelliae]KRN22266.1 hypothetical protein FC75_GL001905 [Lacticaseibacillus camelliae DSM 22697 = JCM 13995]